MNETHHVIIVVLFVRDDYFEFDGRCLLEMKTAEDAQRVIEYGNRRMIGGNVLRLSHVSVVVIS